MTDEVAIQILKNIQAELPVRYKGETFEKCNDALNKAIGSLQTPNIFREFVFKATKTEIPPNATNGDVMCLLFPNARLSECMCIDMEWWNSPYKAESEETEMEELDFIQPKKVVGKLISVDVLDKIRAEIKQEYKEEFEHPYGQGLRRAIEIIDKYKAESED